MKKTNSLFTITIMVLALSVTGCTQSKHAGRQMVVEPDPVSLRLSSAVDRASAALQVLAAVEQRQNPLANVSPIENAPRELMRTLSVEWSGSVAPIAKKLADRAGYKFNIIGMEPPVPVIVNITAVEKTVIDILRDIGLQSGRRADIVVNAEQELIEVSYNSIHGGDL